MPETREERKHRDLRLADTIEQRIGEMQELVKRYYALTGKVPDGWEEDQFPCFPEMRQLIALLRGEEPKSI